MKLLTYVLVVAFIVVLVLTCTESKGGRGGFRSGGGYRSGSRSSSRSSWFSSSRRSSSSVVTSRPRSSYGRDYYGSRRSSSVATSRPRPNNYASKVTTPRTYVNRNNYYDTNRQSRYSGSDTRQPYYGGSYGGGYYGGGYYGGYRNRQNYTSTRYFDDSGRRRSIVTPIVAGLGGSALGMYLGYQLGGLSNTQYGSNGNENYPRYSVVHHYHHGDQKIVKNAKIEENVISKCNNVTFCIPNTQPLCLTNGTVYCLTAVKYLTNCTVNSKQMQCVNTTLAAPCINDVTKNCTDETPKKVAAEIPCLTNVYLLGDFSTGKLEIHKKDEIVTDKNASSSVPAKLGSTLSDKSFLDEYCVIVIANPVPLSNGELLDRMLYDDDIRSKLSTRFQVMLNNLLHQ